MAYKIEIPDENNEQSADFLVSPYSVKPVTPVTVVTEPVKSRAFPTATGNLVVTEPVTSGNQSTAPIGLCWNCHKPWTKAMTDTKGRRWKVCDHCTASSDYEL